MKKGIILAAAVAVIGVAGAIGLTAVLAGGSGTSVKAEVRLQSNSIDPLASGKAKSEQRTGTSSDRTRFSVEVEDVSSAGAHSVRITRSGVEIANSPVSVTVDALGFGELELNTQDGAVNVPVAVVGDFVEVLNPNGVVILSGTLVAKG